MTTDRRRRVRGSLTPAGAALIIGPLLLFTDSFLPWERVCVSVVRVAPICEDFWTAWSGRGAFAGAAMAILSGALAALQTGLTIRGAGDAPGRITSALHGHSDDRLARISVGLAIGTFVFGAVKLAFVVTDHSTYGSYVAVPLLLLIAAGAAAKSREMNRVRG